MGASQKIRVPFRVPKNSTAPLERGPNKGSREKNPCRNPIEALTLNPFKEPLKQLNPKPLRALPVRINWLSGSPKLGV